MPRQKVATSIVGKVALGIAGLLLGLILAELLTRLLVPPGEGARVVAAAPEPPVDPASVEPLNLELQSDTLDGGILYRETPTGMRLRPNTRARIENHHLGGRTVEIRTNSIGYRNPELLAKTRKRILFLGDSITAQDYLPDEETIVRMVETLSVETGESLETVNAGAGGIGLANELAILLETGLATEPDALVLNWYLNDVRPSRSVELFRVRGIAAYSRLVEVLMRAVGTVPLSIEDDSMIPGPVVDQWRDEFVESSDFAWGDYKTNRGAFNAKIVESFTDWGSAWADGAWDRMRPLLAEMARQAKARGVPFLIVAFPAREQVETDFVEDFPQRRLAEVAGSLGVPMLDLLPFLRELRGKTPVEELYLDSCHPSALGSRFIAERTLEFVRENAMPM